MVGQVGPEGNGGVPVTFFQQAFVLTNAQILALLGGSAIELLPAPGSGKAYGVLAVLCTADCTAAAYTFTGTALVEFINTGGTGALLGGTIAEDAADAFPLLTSGGAFKVTASLRGKWADGGDGSETPTYEDKALQIAILGTPSGIGGGNAANTLKVTVLYTILDV